MTVPTTRIQGKVLQADGSVREKSYVLFTQTKWDTDGDHDSVIVSPPIRADIDATGNIDVSLWSNEDGPRGMLYQVDFHIYNGVETLIFAGSKISVPTSGGPYDLNDLLGISPPEDTTVDEYIAYLAAATDSAQLAAISANESADRAELAAEGVSVSVFSFSEIASISDIEEGGYISDVSSGGRYQRASDTSTDFDLDYSGIGGVKWYVLPSDSGSYNPQHFGAVGDGVANDYEPLVACISKGYRDSRVVDGAGLTYIVGTSITQTHGVVRDLTIDASGLSSSTVWSAVAANYEAPKTITSDVRQGERSFSCVGHGYSVGDVVLVQSGMELETSTNSVCSHWGKVSDVTTNSFTTHEVTLCNLLVADSVSVKRLPLSPRAELDNVKIIGGPNVLNGYRGTRFTDITINASFVDCADRSCLLVENYAPKVKEVEGINSDTVGLGYALGMAGNGWPIIDKVVGRRCRHVLTFGASSFIPSVGGVKGDIVGYECLSAADDTHPACIGVEQVGVTVADFSAELTGEDCIVFQGIGGSVNAVLTGPVSRHAFLLQPFHTNSAFDFAPSYTIRVKGGNPNEKGVTCDLDDCGDINVIDINYMGSASEEPVYIDIGGISVEEIKISGSGVSYTSRAIRVICEPTSDLGFLDMSGRWTAAAGEAVYVLGQTDGLSRTTEWSFGSGKSSGGTYGLRATNKVNAIVGAVFLDGTVDDSVVTGGASLIGFVVN